MSIQVLVVDDSAVVRQVMTAVLNASNDIEVYDTASDPVFALAKLEKKWPDVIVLDIEMPRMDGITFLKKVMEMRPTPVVICSSLAEKGAQLSLNALSAGAVDIVTKPQMGVKGYLQEAENEIRNIVRAAAKSRPKTAMSLAAQNHKIAPTAPEPAVELDLASMSHTTDRIVAIGSSTGGTIALEKILTKLPRTCPGIVIVQHMPEKFTKAFAERLNSICAIEVAEADSGDRIIPGKALIAPGGQHLEVKRSGGQYITIVKAGPAVNRHCPSVDVLFRSAAKSAQRNAMGIILTGMGNDGAQGLLAMRQSGSRTYAQNEASSVVFGMPKEAIALGGAEKIIDLEEVAGVIR